MRFKFLMAACMVSVLMLSARAGFVDGTAAWFPGGVMSNGSDSVSLVDFNSDGFVDVRNGSFLYRNDGEGHAVYAGKASVSYVWGDYTNDGLLDRFIWLGSGYLNRLDNSDGTDFTTYHNNSVMPLLPPAVINGETVYDSSTRQGAVWGDWDNDGWLDLYVTGYELSYSDPSGFPDAILMNNAGAAFSMTVLNATTNNRARGATACDFDQDGDLDIYVSCYRLRENNLWLNDGSGHFTDVATARGVAGEGTLYYDRGHTIGSCWGDFNEDGYFDLFVGNFAHADVSQDRPMLMQNMGPNNGYTFVNRWTLDGTQYQESYAVPMAADYDNDGDLDLFFTTVYAGDTSRLWRNDGNWVFTDVTASSGLPSTLGQTYGAAWGDINNDGFPDLLTNNKIFINQGNANKWLKVRLLGNGTTVNRSAIGAQARIALSNKTLVRQVEGASGKASQNEMTLHFGLGSRTTPVDLTITWPDGTTQTIEDVALNQTLTVTAPAAMSVSVQSLTPVAERGNEAAAQSFTVQSDSLQPMAFAVSDNAAWLSLSPASGTALEGTAAGVQVTYDTGSLTSGTYHATITVTSANVTNSPQAVAVTLTVVPQAGDLPIVETFESDAVDTLLASVGGWSGDPAARVAALAYTPAIPPGYPVPEAAHAQVAVSGDPLARTVNGAEGQNINMDFMIQAKAFEDTLPDVAAEGGQMFFGVASNGVLHVWHMAHEGSVWTQRWTDLGMPAFADGAWVRISVRMDYTSNPSDTFFQPRVNGSLCLSPYAFKSPTDLTSPGTWYLCADTPGKGGGGLKKISGIEISGQSALDDLTVTVADQPFPHTGATSTNGVPFVWFDQWGLARFPGLDYDGDGLDALGEYTAGTDPVDPASSFRIIDTWTENGSVYLRFLGNDSGASTPYVIERQSGGLNGGWTVADPAVPRAQAPNAVNTWSEPLQPSGPAFYRVKAPAAE
ncbi:MAG: FG-GAP-like repeat-containing protein [Kiritimatiellae bacterium]|nr:FG-GAP-like repeat-containing protein [Kiritimatiellia bacterium]